MKLKRNTIILLVIIGIVVILGIVCIGSYNSMVSANENVKAKFSAIDTNLTRRAELIPNLVNTVKGAAAHEQEVIDSVTTARAQLAGAGTPAEKAEADAQLTSALSRLMMVVENYPDIKANQNYIALMDELAGTENRLLVARKDYNDAAKDYNQRIKSFPASIIAGIGGFTPYEYYEAKEQQQVLPQVSF